jgi:hypothetical protein
MDHMEVELIKYAKRFLEEMKAINKNLARISEELAVINEHSNKEDY